MSLIADAATPFQEEDIRLAVKAKRFVLGHKTGLGKTFIALGCWEQWKPKRVLIIGTLSSSATWLRLLKKWLGLDGVFIQGQDEEWQNVKRKKVPGIWLCTYATMRILMDKTAGHLEMDLVVCDEMHRALRNRNKTTAALDRIDSDYFLGLTATWVSKGPQDLFPVLHHIDKGLFPSYWRFVETWCFVTEGQFAKEIFGVRNADKLRTLLTGYYKSRTWKEVGNQFGRASNEEPVVRRSEIVPMAALQIEMHESMLSEGVARLGKEFVLAPNPLTRLNYCLQLSLSPRMLFPDAEVGSTILWLWEQIDSLESVVIFLPFKKLADICASYFRASGWQGEMYSLVGGLSPEVLNATIAAWNKSRGIMFCTIGYAQSIPLDTTDYAYFLGFDWDPNNNIQAEGRLRRLDTVDQEVCLATYIVPENSEYYRVRDVINGKVENVRQVMKEYGL